MSKKSKKKSPKNKASKKPASAKKASAVRKPVKKKSAKKTTTKKPKAKKSKPVAKKQKAKKVIKKKKPVVAKKPAKKKIEVKKVSAPTQKAVVAKVVNKPATKAAEVITVKPEIVKTKSTETKKQVRQAVIKRVESAISKKSVIIDIKTGPEPAGRFELEYIVHASAPILFEFLTSPSGLSEWFCDDLNIRNGIYTFKWDENEQPARVVKLIDEKQVRFQWVDKTDNSYFEFRVERDDLTNDISLIIVDFAETAEEQASTTLLWNSQVAKLLHVLGSYF